MQVRRLPIFAAIGVCATLSTMFAFCDNQTSGDIAAAVNSWREQFDPLYAYKEEHCSLVQEISSDFVQLLRGVFGASRATVCDRLRAQPETVRNLNSGALQREDIVNYDARPGSTLRFTLTNSNGREVVTDVQATTVDGDSQVLFFQAGDRPSAPGLTQAYRRWMPVPTLPWQITHVITYGQSLSQGFYNKPVLSTHQRYNAVRFSGGVRAQDADDAAHRDDAYGALVPLVEATAGDKSETPTAGTLDMIMQLMEQEDLRKHGDIRSELLGSAPGEGSKDISDLSDPGRFYAQLLSDVRHGKAIADAQHKSYGVAAITWTQGESDDSGHTSLATYESSLRKLRNDVDRDVKATTGQKADVEMVTYQLTSNRSFDQAYPHIALALLKASHDDPHIHLATPMYIFRYVDGRHTDNRSTRWLGAYYGLVIKRLVIDHVQWKPLEPASWRLRGDTVTVRFNVPAPPLRWDTRQVAANEDYGFRLTTSDGHVVPIDSVQITSPDTVTIKSDRALSSGTHLAYAFSGEGRAGSRYGPRGNLRDSQGDFIKFDDGKENLRLDDWCVVFDVAL
jgi:hypothetical protein